MSIKQKLATIEIAKSELEIELLEIISKKIIEFQKEHKVGIDGVFIHCGKIGTIDIGNVLVIDRVDIDFDKAEWLLMNLGD